MQLTDGGQEGCIGRIEEGRGEKEKKKKRIVVCERLSGGDGKKRYKSSK